MIMRSLDINDDSVWSQKKYEELLGDETPYLGAISALVHFANNITRYLFCSKFAGKIQFLTDKRTLKWCWAHDWISSKDHNYEFILFRGIQHKIDWLRRCRIFIWSAWNSISSTLCVCMWRHNNILAINEINVAMQKPFMKKVESASGWDKWHTIFMKYVVFLWKRIYQP